MRVVYNPKTMTYRTILNKSKFQVIDKKDGRYNHQPTHNLKELADLMWVKYSIEEPYMGEIPDFCNCYSKMLEGDNVEYFRYPEYSRKRYFAGNRLDIEWLSYNFALILLKLLQFANLTL